MDFASAIAKIYEHLEADNVEGAVMASFRVARSAQDHLATIVFLRELHPGKDEVARTLYDDTSHLSKEAQKFVWERSLDRWLEVHTMDVPISPDDGDEDRTVLKVAAGDIQAELKQWEAALADLTPPHGMSPFDTAAFHDSSNSQRARIRMRMMALQTIKSRLKTRCFNYAVQIEKQLGLQGRNQALLWNVENDVNNYFKERFEDVFYKLVKASQLASSSQTEDAALLLTEVRRVLRAAADFFYPPREGPVVCADGQSRQLGEEQYMNRLEEFLVRKMRTSTAKELATAELKLLATFMRRLNNLASKGVHAEVSHAESRQGLVGLYMFLSTITQHFPQAST